MSNEPNYFLTDLTIKGHLEEVTVKDLSVTRVGTGDAEDFLFDPSTDSAKRFAEASDAMVMRYRMSDAFLVDNAKRRARVDSEIIGRLLDMNAELVDEVSKGTRNLKHTQKILLIMLIISPENLRFILPDTRGTEDIPTTHDAYGENIIASRIATFKVANARAHEG